MTQTTETALTLHKLRTLLTPPHHFTKDTFARTLQGCGTEPTDPAAAAWCLRGALIHSAVGVAGGQETPRYQTLHAAVHQLLTQSAQQLYQSAGIAAINDDHGHAAVLTIIDTALATLEQREGHPVGRESAGDRGTGGQAGRVRADHSRW